MISFRVAFLREKNIIDLNTLVVLLFIIRKHFVLLVYAFSRAYLLCLLAYCAFFRFLAFIKMVFHEKMRFLFIQISVHSFSGFLMRKECEKQRCCIGCFLVSIGRIFEYDRWFFCF